MRTEIIRVGGMTCTSCEKIIEDAISAVPGVKSTKASFEKGEVIIVMKKEADEKKIHAAIKDAGYSIGSEKGFATIALGAIAILAALYLLFGNSEVPFSPQADAGFVALFILGVLTGFHCVGMCGGFVLSYTLSGKNSVVHHATYGASRLISYTVLGAFFGLLGSAIAITIEMRAAAALLAGIFLILYGIGMLGIIPQLNRFRVGMPSFLGGVFSKMGKKGPAAIGIINGLMIACGPLQAMYIFAAGTGDLIAGAASLFAFGLGTLPAMFAFGTIGSIVGTARLNHLVRYSGVLVVFLGLLMLNNGIALTGNVITGTGPAQNSSIVTEGTQGYQEIYMEATYYGYEPDSFVLKKGVPVRWVINGKEVGYCNDRIIIPEYDMEFSIKSGEQVIEFTPEEEGVVGWSCWMGMIPGQFIITDDGEGPSPEEMPPPPQPTGTCSGACGGSCSGGCGCGG